ncbi:hypothetical protein [Rhizobium sp. BK176]|uniref:hypothetical protein n=1 Tax=Rhizobium sp. BK176 TaxID=2587071 RepID=UPI00216893BA|nr:hypothetical protein [Rhizobium sp. BK176]MCS4089104.1 hypothetical protein [Rhizobium sp. BK176]
MRDNNLNPGPFPGGDSVSFRLMSNIIDIALAVGECAEAMRSDFGCDTDATAAASRLVAEVRMSRLLAKDSGSDDSHRTSDHSREDWSFKQAKILGDGFSIYVRLREYSAVTLGNRHAEPLSRLARKISEGFRLNGLHHDTLAA